MAKKLVLGFSPWGNGESIFPFNVVFDTAQDVRKHGFQGIDALVLWGGEDIHPSFYDEKAHKYNQAGPTRSARDVFEWKAMLYCKMNNIPIIGVCRGAQFLCAFAGGSLVQHVEGHTNGHHMVVTLDGEEYSTTSAHHQMMQLEKTEHQLLAWSKKKLSTVYQDGEHSEIAYMKDRPEPEVVYFPKIRGLAVQGHPEWIS